MTRAEKVAIALLLIGACSAVAARAQSPAMPVPDSVDASVLRDYADTTVAADCLDGVVRQIDSETGAVLVLELVRAAPGLGACDGHNGLVAFVRDARVTPENLLYLDKVVLEQNPGLLFVCGGQRTGALRSPGAVYPYCLVRRPKLGPEA